jgi:MFS family permease
MPADSASHSAFAPLREPLFRALWIATVVSNVGTWMNDVSAAWLMTTLSASPLVVAAVQAATSVPMFVLALPAGALADIVDRRRLLIVTQSWMLAVALVLAETAHAALITPLRLLALAFALGVGAAMTAPAWQAITQVLVSRESVTAAVTLNGVGVNIARAIGPAIGGAIVAASGPAAAFFLNALSFIGVIAVLTRWQRLPGEHALPPERFFGAIRSGFRYVRRAPAVQAALVRGAAFTICASALWALLPVFVRVDLRGGPEHYGLLLGCLGVGAIVAALAMPAIRGRISVDRLIGSATLGFALAMGLAYALRGLGTLAAAMTTCGACWMLALSTLNVAVQTSVPAWVRARALGTYLLVFFGAMAIGSALWGAVATRVGTPTALAAAAGVLVLGFVTTRRFEVTSGEGLDLAPSIHWPAPAVVGAVEPDRGPVLVTVEYRIDPARTGEFAMVMDEIQRIRRRDGAFLWGLFVDTADPGRCIESFLVDSWIEHLRQHARVTVADRVALDRARQFQLRGEAPLVSHLVAVEGPTQ